MAQELPGTSEGWKGVRRTKTVLNQKVIDILKSIGKVHRSDKDGKEYMIITHKGWQEDPLNKIELAEVIAMEDINSTEGGGI